MCIQRCGWQRCQPAQNRPRRAAEEQRHAPALQQPLSAVNVLGGGGMLEGFHLQIVGLAPDAGPDVQAGDGVSRQLLLQPLSQQLAEKMVIAIPAPLVVQRDNEQVGALQGNQRRLPSSGCILQDGVAQWPAQAIENGGAQQEVLDACRLPLQNLLHQVVEHETVAAAEGCDEACRVGSALHRNGRQVQAGDPALGARLQSSDLRLGEVQPHHLVEKFCRLIWGETQIGGAQLGQLAAGAQAGQRQWRVLACGDHQMHL
jgi:hypothetical protein